MAVANPVTQAEKDRVAELHAQGLSRNEIARQLGRSGKTISRIAEELGLDFEHRGRTSAATAAKIADGQERRARLQVDALESAQRLMGQMFAETKVYNIGGKDNVYTEHKMPEPPFRDKRDISIAVTNLTNTAIRLAEYDKGNDLGGAKSMLGALAASLGLAHQLLQQGESTEGSDGAQP